MPTKQAMSTKLYLKQVMKLESSVYEQEYIIRGLKESIHALEHPAYACKQSKYSFFSIFDSVSDFLYTLVGFLFGGAFLGGVVYLILCPWVFSSSGNMMEKLFVFVLVGLALGLVAFCVFMISSSITIRKNNKEIAIQNQYSDQYNAAIKVNNPIKIAKLRAQLAGAEQNLEVTYNILSQLYAKNVIHPKYRTLVAVSMLYEYFDTGRCATLQGHGGAYDTYEHELRQNIIIGKLDVVIDKLDQIIDSQYSLYQAINECNWNISKVYDGLTSLQETSSQILECAEVTAYNSRISAANTSLMRNLMIYDHI